MPILCLASKCVLENSNLKINCFQVSPGGGFGPVSDDGYGVAYMIPGDFKFFFHVGSKKSSKVTDSSLFMKQLFETLDEMKQLFECNE